MQQMIFIHHMNDKWLQALQQQIGIQVVCIAHLAYLDVTT
jgi:hypothetical protein